MTTTFFSGCHQHEWKEATCVEPKTCTVCKKTEGELGEHDRIPATCENPSVCSVCGESEGSPLGHEYDSWKISKDPSATEDGERIQECLRCEAVQTASISKIADDDLIKLANQNLAVGRFTEATKILKLLENDEYAQNALKTLDSIRKKGWVGIYQSEEDSGEYVFITCTVDSDTLDTEYSISRQSRNVEILYSDITTAVDQNKFTYIDEIDNTASCEKTEEVLKNAKYHFQPDGNVYVSYGSGGFRRGNSASGNSPSVTYTKKRTSYFTKSENGIINHIHMVTTPSDGSEPKVEDESHKYKKTDIDPEACLDSARSLEEIEKEYLLQVEEEIQNLNLKTNTEGMGERDRYLYSIVDKYIITDRNKWKAFEENANLPDPTTCMKNIEEQAHDSFHVYKVSNRDAVAAYMLELMISGFEINVIEEGQMYQATLNNQEMCYFGPASGDDPEDENIYMVVSVSAGKKISSEDKKEGNPYDTDDPYYSANDINHDGFIDTKEFQNAVGDLAEDMFKLMGIEFQKTVTNIESSQPVCIECGKEAYHTYKNFVTGEDEYYCKQHYEDILGMMDKMESDVGDSDSAKHYCEASGCNKAAYNEITGLSGNIEYYCTEHYQKMLDIEKELFGNN